MVPTQELLMRIERESVTAPAVLLRHRIAMVRGLAHASEGECSSDLAEHARALLLKLEQRLSEECSEHQSLRRLDYLSPGLRIPVDDAAGLCLHDGDWLPRDPVRTWDVSSLARGAARQHHLSLHGVSDE
ncbi:hypothetical protein SAMN05216359_102531 [Roseateles sp. YR242]|uniref:hypothetical protein n=1 Tax=Roseateles sp. YR242 TaxID=1855305 RepID=UPI0008C2F1FD|nr:hypothetical protein [Roseateles sp. YR242]SEK64654.1 hypothetical protein SAMN05216359_102531 [Roseateles sp. YR242]